MRGNEKGEITSAGLLQLIKRMLQDRDRQRQIQQIREMSLPQGVYQVIVIDPPWQYWLRSTDITHRGRTRYPSMSMDELKSLYVPIAEDGVVWLWATNAFLREAFTLLDCWGLDYKTMLTWVKPYFGIGNWLRGQTEHCSLAIKGNYVIDGPGNVSTALLAPRGEHSEKPDAFYQLVESLCPGKRLDMFAGKRRPNWECWPEAGELVSN